VADLGYVDKLPRKKEKGEKMKMNKKKSVEAILAVITIVLIVQTVFPVLGATKTDITWDTSGVINISITADDDANTYLNTAGNHIFGEFHTIDYNDNPYNYKVDTFTAWTEAQIEGGGYVVMQTTRTDSKTSMYGPAGQISYSYIETDSWGFLKFKDWTNYAQYRGAEYGFQSNNQFQANGTHFIIHQLLDSDGEGMYVLDDGDGLTQITVMNSESRGSSWKFGKGCGCYTNAKASGNGSGHFEVSGWASNYLKSDLGFTLPSGGSFTFSLDYNNGFAINNFASEGN